VPAIATRAISCYNHSLLNGHFNCAALVSARGRDVVGVSRPAEGKGIARQHIIDDRLGPSTNRRIIPAIRTNSRGTRGAA